MKSETKITDITDKYELAICIEGPGEAIRDYKKKDHACDFLQDLKKGWSGKGFGHLKFPLVL